MRNGFKSRHVHREADYFGYQICPPESVREMLQPVLRIFMVIGEFRVVERVVTEFWEKDVVIGDMLEQVKSGLSHGSSYAVDQVPNAGGVVIEEIKITTPCSGVQLNKRQLESR
jgi:hypothetical protein